MQVLMIAVLPLVGVIIGAAVQYAFGRRLDARKLLLAQRVQAYVDFIRAVSASTQDASKDYLALVTDAKTRICLYGSLDVVQKLGDFGRAGSAAATPAGQAALVGLIRAMRQDVTDSKVTPRRESLGLILFNQGPPERRGRSG